MQPKKKTSPVFWLVLVAAGVAAFVMTEPPDEGARSPSTRNATRKAAAATGLIREEDLKARFARVNNPTKNAFMPIVKKSSGVANASPSALPIELTGGEAGWAYTGTAAVDGRIQAVVENPGTGQGDFLSVGQNWKRARVGAVSEDSLTLEGSDGQQITVKMQEKLSSSSMLAGGFAPVDISQGLRGQIGPVAVRPEGETPGVTVASEGEGNAN